MYGQNSSNYETSGSGYGEAQFPQMYPSAMQAEMFGNPYQSYTQSQQFMQNTPTTSEWGSFPNSPAWWSATACRNNTTVIADKQRSSSAANGPSQVVSEGKKYRHDPYASGSEQNTPPCSPLTQASSHNSAVFTDNYAVLPGTAAPVYDPSYVDISMPTQPVSQSIEEQFQSIVGCVAQTACSSRGRSLLLNVIRLQHLDKIQIIFEELCAGFATVVADSHGCHVLRFMIDYMQDTHMELLMQTLNPTLLYQLCTLSQHSRRVLQCLVEQHKTPLLQPMINMLCQNRLAVDISKTQQGCIAIMRVFENVLPQQKEQLFHYVAPFFPELSMDQFGNYTVQTVLQQFDSYFLSATFQEVFFGQFVRISCNKFGSNVMEKMIPCASPQLLGHLLDHLCFNEPNLQRLMNDGFGNFVLQALVDASANTPDGRRVCEAIRPHLHSSPYGHKIEGKLRNKRLLTTTLNEVNRQGGSSSSCGSSACGDGR